MSQYGDLPVVVGRYHINCPEMMFYQYLPIKMPNRQSLTIEKRLNCFRSVLNVCENNYCERNSTKDWLDSYVYLTVKHMWQDGSCSYNRKGWHSDSFMSNDINYIWSNCHPTVFNKSKFDLMQDDKYSLMEMESQALPENDVIYPDSSLLRLNQYNIHRVGSYPTGQMRTFLKLSVSKDKYDLIGNSHNYELDYNWEMRPRTIERNIPQNV